MAVDERNIPNYACVVCSGAKSGERVDKNEEIVCWIDIYI